MNAHTSKRHRDQKRPGTKQSARALAALGIYTPEGVALWARKHGLLSVYLQAWPVHGVVPPCWQVLRPGYKTDPNAPGWHRGNKTFVFYTNKDRPEAERNARAWASAHFDVEGWVRIEGIGGALFPALVGDALQAVDSDIIIARDRHTVKTWRPE